MRAWWLDDPDARGLFDREPASARKDGASSDPFPWDFATLLKRKLRDDSVDPRVVVFEDRIERLEHDTKHRADGPAVLYESGRREWWFEGRTHRLDGPAITGDGDPRFFIYGFECTPEEFEVVREEAAGAPASWVIAYLEGRPS